MQRLTRRLILLLALAITITAFTLPAQTTTATTTDCDFLSALCRLTAEVNYNLCILKGGSVTDCAYAEAVERINCIASAGCGKPLPTKPGDN